MNTSTLKIVVPLALFFAVVFAVVLFNQYAPTEGNDPKNTEIATGEKPLRFFTTSRHWDPIGNLQDRIFPGFYELSDQDRHATSFWFENRNAAAVKLQLRDVSCSACTGGRVAPIPPEAMRDYLQAIAVSMLPWGPGPIPGLALTGPAIDLVAKLEWQDHLFTKDKDGIVYNIPAAGGDRWAPQWGILELNFTVRASKMDDPLRATFQSQIAGAKQVDTDRFEIAFEASPPFGVDQTVIDVGDLTDSSPTQTHEVLIFSTTLPALPELSFKVLMPPGVGGEPGNFIGIGQAIPVPATELESVMIALSNKQRRPIRVTAALRLPIAIKVRDGDAKLDIGQVDRVIWIAKGADQLKIAVKGTMQGAIYLKGVKEIYFGNFNRASGASVRVDVATDRPGAELVIVPGLTQPKLLKAIIEKHPDRGDRGEFRLTVSIPKGELLGEITDGVVVLEATGANPQRIRIPVKGKGIR